MSDHQDVTGAWVVEFGTPLQRLVLPTDGIVTCGRDARATIPAADPACSREQFRLLLKQGNCTLEPLSSVSPTFLNGAVVTNRCEVWQTSTIRAGSTEIRIIAADRRPGARDVPTVAGVALSQFSSISPVLLRDVCVLGRDPTTQACLASPQVSRRHAEIQRQGSHLLLRDLGSTNGTFCNGERVANAIRLRPGDVIGVGPFSLTFDGDRLLPHTREGNARLVVRNAAFSVRMPNGAGDRVILDDLSLVVEPGEFLAIIGPSGSGKSTLLGAMTASRPLTSGAVYLNQYDLSRDFEELKHDLAVVSQTDVLHRDLPLQWAITYTARLRLPRDTRPHEISSAVEQALHTTGLWAHRWTRVRNLSGGQVRRTSIALELLARPSLLFLDEVTSGLDEQIDREMMELFRRLADQGQTVICITHNLNHVEGTCHQLAVLAEGGRLAYLGPPQGALAYFQVPHLAGIHGKLRDASPQVWQQRFRSTDDYATRITDRCHQPQESSPRPPASRLTSRTTVAGSVWHQVRVLLARGTRLVLGDPSIVVVLILQCLLVAGLNILAFGRLQANGPPPDWNLQRQTCSMLFLMAMSCYWFGCTNASKELVRERDIFLREQRAGLSVPAYLISKAAFPIVFSALQALLLYIPIALCCDLPGRGPLQAIWLIATAVTGVSLGLLISAIARSESLAVALVPMAMIPQIILSDAVQSLSGWAKKTAEWGVTLFWANGALRSTLPEPRHPLLPAAMPNTSAAVMLCLHAALAVAAALFCLSPRGQRLIQRCLTRRFRA